MTDDELGAGMRERIVPHTVAGEVVAGGGQAGNEGRGGVTVAANRLVVVVVADVKGVLIITGDRRRPESVELTAVKACVHRAVLQVNPSNAAVAVVHGNVEHTAAHLHGNRVAVGDVAVGVCRVRRPCACTVAVRDDSFSKLTEIPDISTSDDQVRAVRPQFVKSVTSVVW